MEYLQQRCANAHHRPEGAKAPHGMEKSAVATLCSTIKTNVSVGDLLLLILASQFVPHQWLHWAYWLPTKAYSIPVKQY
jgi:hypothetical protein